MIRCVFERSWRRRGEEESQCHPGVPKGQDRALAGAVQRGCGVSSGDVQLCLDITLCSLLWVNLLLQGVGLDDPQKSLPTPNILLLCDLRSAVCGAFTCRLLQDNAKLSIIHLGHILLPLINLLSNQFPNYFNKPSFSFTKLYYLKAFTFDQSQKNAYMTVQMSIMLNSIGLPVLVED